MYLGGLKGVILFLETVLFSVLASVCAFLLSALFLECMEYINK